MKRALLSFILSIQTILASPVAAFATSSSQRFMSEALTQYKCFLQAFDHETSQKLYDYPLTPGLVGNTGTIALYEPVTWKKIKLGSNEIILAIRPANQGALTVDMFTQKVEETLLWPHVENQNFSATVKDLHEVDLKWFGFKRDYSVTCSQ